MKKKFAIVGISVFMSAILLLSGCGGSSSGSDSAGSEPDNAANGSGEASSAQSEGEKLMANATARMGTVTVANGEGADRDDLTFISVIEPTSLEPGGLASSDSNFRVVATQIYETLVRETPMDRTQLQPMLAESWEFNEDNTQVTFKIKEGVKFHNGDTMTADDVAYSLNRAIGLATNADISEMMADAVVVDDTHVTLNLKYAYGPVLNILTNPNFAVVSQKYVEECEANGTNFGRNPMGTGAYKFVEWINGSSITLEAFEEWNGGDVPIKNLTYNFITDTTTAAVSLESGDADLLYGSDSADMVRMVDNPDINVMATQSSGFYFLTLNTESELLSDERVRKAIAMCIDRQEIIDGGQDGLGWATECPITPGIFGYQEDFKATATDPEGAKALLAEAGYPDGITIKFICPEANYYSRPAQVIQEQLRRGGINAELTIMERGAFDTDLSNRNFEMSYSFIGASYPDADNIVYKLFHSQYANTTGQTNMANVVDEEADRIVETARKSSDSEERYALYGELSALNDANAWYIPILTSTNSIVASAQVGGVTANSGSFYYVSDYTYQPEAE
ncbi:ABC transporter substrate-binding protein [Anaerotignum faecicola]|nr:ABC transporter substrate-binding protein [Anaerotignum faecicola]